MSKTFDIVILGGGPAGYVCAIRSAQLGFSTAVIEKEKLGGVCVNIGCIPSKALLHSAHIAHVVQHDAKALGLNITGLTLDYGVAMKRSRGVADQNAKGVEYLMKKHKVTVITGTGKVGKDRKVTVNGETYTATKALVIATGTRTKGIPQIGLELDRKVVISSDEALFLETAPKTMAIVGAGAVGVEFADIFSSFGTQITLIEALPRILPNDDAEASATIAKVYKKRKINVLAGAKISNVKVAKDKVTMDVESGGKTEKIEVERVLMAAGRALNLDDLGLDAAGIKRRDNGFIQVDANLQTTAPGVYAIGDIAGPPMLAHKGSREGVYVAEHVAGHKPHKIRYDNIPSVTYCHPEVASIGLTEEQCKEQKLDYTVGKFPFSANGRARATNETEGFVKILREAKYGEILGAHIVSGSASEMIHELTVARENEYTVEEVDLAVHAHPTLSEAIAEAALDSMGRVMHI
ncbi:MAG: dihydrolipoyl dehydrogenase [Gemmatimonadales bacterium]